MKEKHKVAIIGRRRIGKSFTIEYICRHTLRTSNKPFFVITFIGNEQLFLQFLQRALDEFDPLIAPPQNLIEAFKLFFWLAYSGVNVFLDEFQLIKMKGAIDLFQVKYLFIFFSIENFNSDLSKIINDRFKTITGSLVLSGSHVSELEDLLVNQRSPLFGRKLL